MSNQPTAADQVQGYHNPESVSIDESAMTLDGFIKELSAEVSNCLGFCAQPEELWDKYSIAVTSTANFNVPAIRPAVIVYDTDKGVQSMTKKLHNISSTLFGTGHFCSCRSARFGKVIEMLYGRLSDDARRFAESNKNVLKLDGPETIVSILAQVVLMGPTDASLQSMWENLLFLYK